MDHDILLGFVMAAVAMLFALLLFIMSCLCALRLRGWKRHLPGGLPGTVQMLLPKEATSGIPNLHCDDVGTWAPPETFLGRDHFLSRT
jgi:hypothetical protein